jgi:hypothetical protein
VSDRSRDRAGALKTLAILALVALALLLPTGARAQSDPVGDPHPAFPWFAAYGPNVYGTVVRYLVVADQVVPLGSPPAGGQAARIRIPGYTVVETTAGLYVPARWGLERLGAGGYRWRWLPAEFRRR